MLVHLAPGDPASAMAGEFATREYIEMVREKYGLDKPIQDQFFIYVSKVLQGDLGYSYTFNRPVMEIIMGRLPNTLLLMLASYVVGIPLGILLGTWMAIRYPSRMDDAAVGVIKLLRAIPGFWGGLMVILFFSVSLRLFPIAGMYEPEAARMGGIVYALDVLWHLILPVLTLVIFWQLPYLSRLTRSSIIEIINEDFIVTARAKGLKENVVFVKHALRNALLPVVTMVGMWFGFAVAGALWTETVFSWPGIGYLTYASIMRRDYPVIMGIWIIVSTMVILTTLAVDIIYMFIDPRIEY